MNRPGRASVEFRSVVKQFGAVRAVDDISFIIEPGTLVTLLGPSGCGKTTTLRLIAGLEIATHGHILIGGEDVTARSAADRDVSMVFQSYALFPHMTVFENVAYGPTVQRLPKTTIRELVQEKLALVGLSGLESRSPSQLYRELTERYGDPAYARIDTAATREQKAKLGKLSPEQVTAGELAGEKITAALTTAPGNGAAIGGLCALRKSHGSLVTAGTLGLSFFSLSFSLERSGLAIATCWPSLTPVTTTWLSLRRTSFTSCVVNPPCGMRT